MAEESFSKFKFECGLPSVEDTFTVNVVPFGSGIMELQMRENSKFVVPVNILTLFACTPFFYVARHTVEH